MSILHVQSAGNFGIDGVNVSLGNPVVAGDCLIVSFAMNRQFGTNHGFPIITDNLNNIWFPLCMAPNIIDGLNHDYQLWTFAALNCAAGSTTVSLNINSAGAAYCEMVVDEYSGVAAVRALDRVAYNSTAWNSGLSTVDSGNVTIAAQELVYSAAYASITGLTFTPSPGFTQRVLVNSSVPLSLASFDKVGGPGTFNNTVTSSTAPTTLQVTLATLSSTPVSSLVVQRNCNIETAIGPFPAIAISFPYPNTAGNSLILAGFLYERTDATVTDTQGNTWNVVYTDPSGTNDTYVIAYALNCAGGPNTVTFTSGAGGTDDTIMAVIAEYTPLGTFVSSSKGPLIVSSTADTGFVPITNVPGILISSLNQVDNTLPDTQLGTKRFQITDSGFFFDQSVGITIADQVEVAPGNYDNIFSIAPHTGNMIAGILGFFPSAPPPPKHVRPNIFSVIVPTKRSIAHLVCDLHGNARRGAWYSDLYNGADITMHYTVMQQDPNHETFVLKGDVTGNVLLEAPNVTDNGTPISCVVGTRESNPGAWAYAWFENPGVDLLPTLNTALTVQATSLGTLIGNVLSLQGAQRITQGIVDTGGGQPLKSMGLRLAWSQTYNGGETKPVTLYMMQWIAVPYPEPILNQRTKGTSHGLRGFQHLYMGQLAYVSPAGPVTITFMFDQPGGAGNTATVVLPATAVVGPDPIKQMFKIPPNKGKIISYDISADQQFFLWPHDCEMWLKEWGSDREYQIVRPWGGAGENPIA